LDYSGGSLNEGSKLFVAVSGAPRRTLASDVPAALRAIWPDDWGTPRVVRPGILAFGGERYGAGGGTVGAGGVGADGKGAAGGTAAGEADVAGAATASGVLASRLEAFTARLRDAGLMESPVLDGLPLWILCDDPDFVAADLDNWLWVTFTRSDPARDVHGVGAFVAEKHWGARGPLVIDARVKPWHAPALEPDPEVARRVELLAAAGGSLHGLI